MKGGTKKKIGEGARWEEVREPQSLPMLNGDFEDSPPVLHHQEQLSYEDQEQLQEQELEENYKEEDEEDEEEDGEEEEELEEKSKLDEGFYEIEAVRRKRIRKGQLQYLIKWRGWPETANTWEPLENLQSCSDVIDAFEESLRSGKHSRKRKRKSSATIPQPKKKQHSSTVSYNGTGVESDETLPSTSLNHYTLADSRTPPQSLIDGDLATLGTTKLHNLDGGFANVGKKVFGSREGNEHDPKLSELKGAHTTNEVTEDKRAVLFNQTKTPEGDFPDNRFTNADCVDPAQNSRRSGARRRKPSSVKRFKQDSASHPNIDSGGSFEQLRNEKRTVSEDYSSHKNTSDIIQIIQPISFSSSIANNVRDVSVMFKAARSDGKEVIVDNKFLKLTNPVLLIDFYEQHLKYNPT